MRVVFLGVKDGEPAIVLGLVHVEPIEGEEGQADIIEIAPEGFEDYLERRVYSLEMDEFLLVSDEKKFNPGLLSHWEQLKLAMRFNGYGGAMVMENDAFEEWLNETGEAESETD